MHSVIVILRNVTILLMLPPVCPQWLCHISSSKAPEPPGLRRNPILSNIVFFLIYFTCEILWNIVSQRSSTCHNMPQRATTCNKVKHCATRMGYIVKHCAMLCNIVEYCATCATCGTLWYIVVYVQQCGTNVCHVRTYWFHPLAGMMDRTGPFFWPVMYNPPDHTHQTSDRIIYLQTP